MPPGNPQLNEVWATSDPGTGRGIQGVISDIVSNVITLVSFTGNRARVPPERFASTWTFIQGPPRTHLRCQTRGCGQPAVFTFQRGPSPEFMCPRHMPSGLRATLAPESPPGLLAQDATLVEERVVPLCPYCGSDSVIPQARNEDLADLDFDSFQCSGCNTLFFYQEHLIPNQLASLLARRPRLAEVDLSPEAWRHVLLDSDTTSQQVRIFSVQARFNRRLQSGVAIRAAGRDRVSAANVNGTTRSDFNEPPPLLTLPPLDSLWANKQSGTMVKVTKVLKDAVHFQNVSDDARGIMTLSDFYEYHRKSEPRKSPPLFDQPPDLKPGEEWVLNDEVYTVVEVYPRTKAIIVHDSGGAAKSVTFQSFRQDGWSRLKRTTVYDRLNQEDDF